ALVHEINHQLSPINFALGDLEAQFGLIERLVTVAPDAVENEVRQSRQTLFNLVKGVRRLTATARLFGRVTIQGQEQILNLDTVIEEVVGLVRDMADRAHVIIDVQALPAPLTVRMPAVQVQQVLLNIIINAIQQISLLRPQEGGHIRVEINQEQ